MLILDLKKYWSFSIIFGVCFSCVNVFSIDRYLFKSLPCFDPLREEKIADYKNILGSLLSTQDSIFLDYSNDFSVVSLFLNQSSLLFLKNAALPLWLRFVGPGTLNLNHKNLDVTPVEGFLSGELKVVGAGCLRLKAPLKMDMGKLIFSGNEKISILGFGYEMTLCSENSCSILEKTEVVFEQIILNLDSDKSLFIAQDSVLVLKDSFVVINGSVIYFKLKKIVNTFDISDLISKKALKAAKEDVPTYLKLIESKDLTATSKLIFQKKDGNNVVFDGDGFDLEMPVGLDKVIVIEDGVSVQFKNCNFWGFNWNYFLLGKGSQVSFLDVVFHLKDDLCLNNNVLEIAGSVECYGYQHQIKCLRDGVVCTKEGGSFKIYNSCLQLETEKPFLIDPLGSLLIRDVVVFVSKDGWNWTSGDLVVDNFVELKPISNQFYFSGSPNLLSLTAGKIKILNGAHLKFCRGVGLLLNNNWREKGCAIEFCGLSSTMCLSETFMDLNGAELFFSKGILLIEGKSSILSATPTVCRFDEDSLLKVMSDSTLTWKDVVLSI